MKYIRKSIIPFLAISLIISLTSCEFLKGLFASPRTQEDWITESREQTDMIFANYMDYAKKTLNEYFPDADIEFECELSKHKDTDVNYVLSLGFGDFALLKLTYQCSYSYPNSGYMLGSATVHADETVTNEEIVIAIQPYVDVLNELAKFSIYLFPEDDPYLQIIEQLCTELTTEDVDHERDLHIEMDFPENNYGEPTSWIHFMVYDSGEHEGKTTIFVNVCGYLTNEHALEYQKNVS